MELLFAMALFASGDDASASARWNERIIAVTASQRRDESEHSSRIHHPCAYETGRSDGRGSLLIRDADTGEIVGQIDSQVYRGEMGELLEQVVSGDSTS